MNTARTVAALAAGVLLSTGIAVSAHADPDPAYPTGTFSIDHTSDFLLHEQYDGDPDTGAWFMLHRTTLSDDTTPAMNIVVKVLPYGAASQSYDRPQVWANTTAPFTMQVQRVGTFTPQVWLTDADHHTTVLDLPAITVQDDYTAPVVTLARPSKANRTRIAGWRVLHGTAHDSGIGLGRVAYQVLQKRHGWWYYLSSKDDRWHRGKKTVYATRRSVVYLDHYVYPGQHPVSWSAPPIKGWTTGAFEVFVKASDRNSNRSHWTIVKGRITRR